MGGTGNTGQEPKGQQAAIAGGSPTTPGWAGSAQAPGTSSLMSLGAPAETGTPVARDYETATGSTGTGATANPSTGLLASQSPMGFSHSPYPTHTDVPTYGAAAPPPAAAAEPAAPAVKPRKAADNVLIDYGHLAWNNPSPYAAQSEIANSIRQGYDKKDWQQFLQFAGAGWKPSAELQEYMAPAERW